jgi:hypothetical protein
MKVELQKLREGFYGQTVGLMEKAINYMTTFWDQLRFFLQSCRRTDVRPVPHDNCYM